MTVVPYIRPDHTDAASGLGNPYKRNLDNAAAVFERLAAAFAPHESQSGSPSLPDMTVTLDGGAFVANGALVTQAQQVSAAFTAAADNPKRGLVYIDMLTGAVGVATGSEAASPSLPALPAGKIPVASVLITVGMTEITNADLTDLRPAWAVFYAAAIPYSNAVSGLAATTVQSALDELADLPLADQVARDIGMTALIAATSTGGVRGAVISWVFNADNASTKSGATFDTDHYHNPGVQAEVSYSGSSNIGDMTAGGGLAASWDNDTNQAGTSSQANATSGFSGKDWGVGVTKTLTGVKVWGRNDAGYTDGGASVTIAVYGKATAPANATDGTLLATVVSGLADVNNANPQEKLSGFVTAMAYRYHWVAITIGSGAVYLAEVEFYETGGPQDMTLSDDAETIGAGCELVDVYVLEKAVDASPTRRIRASIDGGATWATGVLQEPDYAVSDRRLYRYQCDVSAQNVGSPSPRQLKVEYNTLNDGKQRSVYRLDSVPLYA